MNVTPSEPPSDQQWTRRSRAFCTGRFAGPAGGAGPSGRGHGKSKSESERARRRRASGWDGARGTAKAADVESRCASEQSVKVWWGLWGRPSGHSWAVESMIGPGSGYGSLART